MPIFYSSSDTGLLLHSRDPRHGDEFSPQITLSDPTMNHATERLRTVHRLYRRRNEARTTEHMAYAIYALILGITVVAVPAVIT